MGKRGIKYYRDLAAQFGHLNTTSKTGFDLDCLDCGARLWLDKLREGEVSTCKDYQIMHPVPEVKNVGA